MPPLIREKERSRSESGPAPGPQLQLDLSDAAPSAAAAAAARESSARSRRRYNVRNGRFMSPETDSCGYANILPARDRSSSRLSSASVSNRNGRGANITNSTRVVNLVDSDVDSSSGSRPLKVPRVSDPARYPKEAQISPLREPDSDDILQKLTDELACSICLDLCYEPCTISCSHTFCKSCLIDSVRACGSRCPKCRREVTVGTEGPLVNSMIWNSIQLLFPEECAERKTAINDKKVLEEEQKRNDGNGYVVHEEDLLVELDFNLIHEDLLVELDFVNWPELSFDWDELLFDWD